MENQAFASRSRLQTQKCFTQATSSFYSLGSCRIPASEALEATYFDLWGAFSPLPVGYPPVPLRTFDISTLEDLKVRLDFERMEAVKIWSQALDIPGYIQASSLVSLTFVEWIGMDSWFYKKYGLPTMIKETLKSECKRVVDDINKKREEEVSKLKLDQQSFNRHSTMASGVNPVDKMFSSK